MTTYQAFEPKYRQLCIKLDKIAPRYDLGQDALKVLFTPAEFYKELKDKIRGAQRRIFLSTLYIGKEEHELV